MIKGWIEDCVCHHSKYCAIHRASTSRLPTRLLYIQKSRRSFRVKLCLGSNSSPSTSYATLSHAWGSGSPIKLLSKNLLEFQQGIPFVRLPPTFADAIQLTDALGLSYLWIDSLCIIQDDLSDWEAESTTMCDVYRGSTINIAASASVDCNGGLFRQRNPLSVTPCVIRMRGNHYALECSNMKSGPVAREPLSGRAWAVQERFLAPRTVHFTTNVVCFECHSGTVSDIDPLNHYRVHKVHRDEGNNWAADSAGTGGMLSEGLLLVRWERVVTIYTKAQLTHESDKLVAIAGLAQFFQALWPNPNTTYLAGLWSLDLGYWLLWRTIDPSSSQRPRNACAPSWSWASVKGAVGWPIRYSWQEYCRIYIVEARTVPPNNAFSSVQRGYIRLRGRMCTAKGNREVAAFLKHNEPWLNDSDQGANRMENAKGLFLLLTYKRKVGTEDTEALVLEFAGDQTGQYQRVGYLSFWERDLRAKLLSFFDEPFRLDQHLYLDVNEDNEYTIDII